MNHLKKFEELDFSQTLPYTSPSNLINYYECKECNDLFKLLNKQVNKCRYCNSKNIELVNRDEWYKKVDDRLDEDEREINQKIKSEEEDDFIDITRLPINNEPLSESIGETKSQRFYKIALGMFLSPISLPVLANYPTNKKIEFIKKSVHDNYIDELAEYELLDEYKYDVEKPSILNKIFKRLKMIKKKKDKYPTISDYIKDGMKFMRLCNIVNFRNREDINYIEEELQKYFSEKSDREWIDEAKKKLLVNTDGTVKLKSFKDEIQDIFNQFPEEAEYFRRDDELEEEED